MRRKLIMGNWKMNGRQDLMAQWVSDFEAAHLSNEAEYALCPPFAYLALAKNLLQGKASLGAQDVSAHADGAYTGEVSAAMLQEVGCQYVLVGHSERRQYHHESESLLAAKLKQVWASKMTAVFCIGETLQQRTQGLTESIVSAQLRTALDILQEDQFENFVIAYEPVWAIGTGQVASLEQISEVHAFLRNQLGIRSQKLAKTTRIIYGGSVKPAHASALFKLEEVDGALVGGASLNASDFVKICEAACNKY